MAVGEIQIVIEAIDRASRQFRVLGMDLRRLGETALGVGLGVGAGVVAVQALRGALSGSIGAAIDFESTFAGIRKTMDLTEEEFNALAAANRRMAREIPVSVNELNRIGEIAGQLGVRGVDNVVKFERTVADLAVTTNLTAEEAATALAQIANVMQVPMASIDRLGAAIVELGNNFATTERDIVEFAQRISGAGKVVGMSAADVAGVATAFSAVGVEAEAGGTAVQKVLLAMQQAAVQGGAELQVFAETLGVTAAEFQKLFQAAPEQVFIRFVEALGQAGPQAIAILDAVGLADQRLISAMLRVAQSGDLLRSAIEMANQASEENVALTIEAEKRYATTASQIQIAKNNFYDLAITIGQVLLPVVVKVSEGAKILAEAVDFAREHLNLVAAALVTLAAVLSGPAGVTGAMAFFALRWREVWTEVPSPVQRAVLSVARFVDQMANSIVAALNETLDAIEGFINAILGKLTGGAFGKLVQKGLGKIGIELPERIELPEIGFRSGIAKKLEDAIAEAEFADAVEQLSDAMERDIKALQETGGAGLGAGVLERRSEQALTDLDLLAQMLADLGDAATGAGPRLGSASSALEDLGDAAGMLSGEFEEVTTAATSLPEALGAVAQAFSSAGVQMTDATLAMAQAARDLSSEFLQQAQRLEERAVRMARERGERMHIVATGAAGVVVGGMRHAISGVLTDVGLRRILERWPFFAPFVTTIEENGRTAQQNLRALAEAFQDFGGSVEDFVARLQRAASARESMRRAAPALRALSEALAGLGQRAPRTAEIATPPVPQPRPREREQKTMNFWGPVTIRSQAGVMEALDALSLAVR